MFASDLDGEGAERFRLRTQTVMMITSGLRRAFSLGFQAGEIAVFIHWRGGPEESAGRLGWCRR